MDNPLEMPCVDDSPRLRFAGRPSLRLWRKEGGETFCHAERSEASIIELFNCRIDPSFFRMTKRKAIPSFQRS